MAWNIASLVGNRAVCEKLTIRNGDVLCAGEMEKTWVYDVGIEAEI